MTLANDPYAPVTIGPGEVVPSDQPTAPYLDAVVAYGFRGSTRFHVPGHKAGAGADPGLSSAIGEDALMLDVPQDIYGIDLGPEPTPFQRAEQLAAEAHGAARSWFLTNGATQGNHALCLALAPIGRARRRAAQLARLGDRRPRALRRAAELRRPGVRGRARDGQRRDPRGARDRAGGDAGRPRRLDRLADLLRDGGRRRRLQPPSARPPASRSSSTRRGARTSASTPTCRRPRSSRAPTRC